MLYDRQDLTQELEDQGNTVHVDKDEYGDPVPNIGIQATVVPPDTPPLNMFGNQNFRTDDRGEFRMIIAPGKYYVKASPFNQGGNQPPEIRTDGMSDLRGLLACRNVLDKRQGPAIEHHGSIAQLQAAHQHRQPVRMV